MARVRPARAAAAIALTAAIGLGAAAAGCFGARKYPGPAPCTGVADCEDHDACTLDYCGADGACDHTFVTPPSAALDDGDPCTEDACAGGVETHTRAAVNSQCSDQVGNLTCNAAGACVTCMQAGSCGMDTECLKWDCVAGACKTKPYPIGTTCGSQGKCDGRGRCEACNDKAQNGGETDIDCGGPCVKISSKTCAAGQHCDEDTDCTSTYVCRGGVCCTGKSCPGTP